QLSSTINSWPCYLPLRGAMVELEYQLTMNNSSHQPKSNPNITPKASFIHS
ncbi:Hypothetical protein FKW44_013197, partial [Caligus rogercresseyi]